MPAPAFVPAAALPRARARAPCTSALRMAAAPQPRRAVLAGLFSTGVLLALAAPGGAASPRRAPADVSDDEWRALLSPLEYVRARGARRAAHGARRGVGAGVQRVAAADRCALCFVPGRFCSESCASRGRSGRFRPRSTGRSGRASSLAPRAQRSACRRRCSTRRRNLTRAWAAGARGRRACGGARRELTRGFLLCVGAHASAPPPQGHRLAELLRRGREREAVRDAGRQGHAAARVPLRQLRLAPRAVRCTRPRRPRARAVTSAPFLTRRALSLSPAARQCLQGRPAADRAALLHRRRGAGVCRQCRGGGGRADVRRARAVVRAHQV